MLQRCRNIPKSEIHFSLKDSPVVQKSAALLTAPDAWAKLLADRRREERTEGDFFSVGWVFCLCTAGKFSLGNSRAPLQLL